MDGVQAVEGELNAIVKEVCVILPDAVMTVCFGVLVSSGIGKLAPMK